MRHSMHLVASFFVLAFVASAGAAVPEDAAARAKVIGQTTALLVQPERIVLSGPRAREQVVVTGKYADGSIRDLTPFVELSIEGGVATVQDGGYLVPVKSGDGSLLVKAGGATAKVALSVKDFDTPQPVSFRRDVIGAMNVG